MWARPKPDGSGRISALVHGHVHRETRACSLWMDGFVTFATGGGGGFGGRSAPSLQSRCQTLVQVQWSHRAHLGCGPAFLLRARTCRVLFGRAGKETRKETLERTLLPTRLTVWSRFRFHISPGGLGPADTPKPGLEALVRVQPERKER